MSKRSIGAVLLAVSDGHGLASGQAIDLSPEPAAPVPTRSW